MSPRSTFVDALNTFSERRESAREQPTDGRQVSAPVFVVPESEELLEIIAYKERFQTMYDAAVKQVVDALIATGYESQALTLREVCLEALYNGKNVTTVRAIAEQGLYRIDAILYEHVLSQPELADPDDDI